LLVVASVESKDEICAAIISKEVLIETLCELAELMARAAFEIRFVANKYPPNP